jgi:hypothetical protein
MSKDKGVYRLNPTKEVMKQGSKAAREEGEKHSEDYRGPAVLGTPGHTRPVAADEGHETKVMPHGHPMMQTRMSHPKEHKHSDGRKHEDHHHAVRMAKGK